MSGVVFIICIPTENQEKSIQSKKKVTIDKNPQVISDKSPKKQDEVLEIQEEKSSMEKILQNILFELEIPHWTWNKSEDELHIQIIFPVESNDKTETILEILKQNKVGKKYNSIVSVVPCSIHYHGEESSDEEDQDTSLDDASSDHDKNSGWNWFLTSVKSRLIVDQVVEDLRSHAALSFDFIAMLILSTSLCAFGLVENSNVFLISSMLMSPMMGPVMAGTFGLVVRDKKLQRMGFKNEIIGLGIATLVGFSVGTIICVFTDKYGEQAWPTYEMVSRGELRNLCTGCIVALLSGAAVAVGILSANVAMLIGVAISTSLMPPAVNAGLLWSMASVYSVKGNNTTRFSMLTRTEHYCENVALELLILGAVSICLTFVNIVCIYFAGILVFKLKEVAPNYSKDPSKKRFWKHDIPMARDYNTTMPKKEGRQLLNAYSQHIPEQTKVNNQRKNKFYHSTEVPGHNNLRIPALSRCDYTWSPCMGTCSRRPEMKELRELYTGFVKTRKVPSSQRRLSFDGNNSQRRLSQIFGFVPSSSPCTNDNAENLEVILERKPLVSPPTNGRKFVVIPCEDDISDKKNEH